MIDAALTAAPAHCVLIPLGRAIFSTFSKPEFAETNGVVA